MSMSTANQYYSFAASRPNLIKKFDLYEDRYRQLAKQLVPWNEFVQNFQHLAEDLKNQVGNVREYCLIRMLEWFKSDLFSWVDCLQCDSCDQDCSFVECRSSLSCATVQPGFDCANVEMYKCDTCQSQYEFPRYNHAGKLLETKRGRCGEWAIAFAYLCFVFDYEVRMVYHFDDHVWVEVFSEHHQRWLHCDPCENAYDNPLMYECGWNKPASLIIAQGFDHLRDVTWRYASKWQNTVQLRRSLFDENELMRIINQANFTLTQHLTIQQRYKIDERWLTELTQFIRLPDQVLQPEPKALQGRISGSLQWREARAEAGQTKTRHVFDCINEENSSNGSIHIRYDCHKDNYVICHSDSDHQSVISQWNNGVYHCENIERTVENDWKMCYLSRNKHCTANDVGTICWRFKIGSKCKIVNVRMQGKTFETGQVELEFILNDKHKKPMQLNELFEVNIQDLMHCYGVCDNSDLTIDIQAKLLNGNGSVAFQHAQLFRQSTKRRIDNSSREDMFEINIIY